MRLVLVSLAFLLVASSMAGARTPMAPSGHADSDGHVLAFPVCHPNKEWLGRHIQVAKERGASQSSQEMRYRSHILVNVCRIWLHEDGGMEDVRKIIAHERGHAFGWEHGEGNPRINPAYWPKIAV